jgi:hypothetical protein
MIAALLAVGVRVEAKVVQLIMTDLSRGKDYEGEDRASLIVVLGVYMLCASGND